MKISDRGIRFIKNHEGLRLTAYRDPVGIWTIGYGHTGADVWAGKTITAEQAGQLLRRDLAEAESAVNELVKVPLTQEQYDALVSFTFNVGSDMDADEIAEGLGDSTLLKKLNAGNYDGAQAEFPKWCKGRINGVKRVLPGLLRRRKAEAALFST